MKQIKSNNWLDLLVRFFLLASDWFRVGVLSKQEIRPGEFHLRSATKPVQEGKRGTFLRGRRFVRLPWIFPLYNNVLSLRLLFLMRMMFISFIIVSCVLIYCVCVFVCLFLFSCVSLIVYKFSPPLPRLFCF